MTTELTNSFSNYHGYYKGNLYRKDYEVRILTDNGSLWAFIEAKPYKIEHVKENIFKESTHGIKIKFIMSGDKVDKIKVSKGLFFKFAYPIKK